MSRVEAAAAEGRAYVGLGRRTLAALIDNLSWLIVGTLLLGEALSSLYDSSPDAGFVASFVFISLWFNYFSFCEWRWGQTMGKNATGIEVISLDGGERLSFGQASMRNLLRLVDFFVIGWVLVADGRRHQRLGDRAAGTAVIRPPRKRAAAAAPPTPKARTPAEPPPPRPHRRPRPRPMRASRPG